MKKKETNGKVSENNNNNKHQETAHDAGPYKKKLSGVVSSLLLVAVLILVGSIAVHQGFYMDIEKNDSVSEAEQDADEYQRTISMLKQEIKNNTDNPGIIASLAWTYFGGENYEEAIWYFKKALEIRKTDDVLSGLGHSYHFLGNEEMAVKYYSMINDSGKDAADAQTSLGWSYKNTQDYEKAEQHFMKALEYEKIEDRVKARAISGLGHINFEQENYEEAIRYFEELAVLRPENPDPVEFLGWSHYKIEEYSESAEYFERALKLEPENEEVRSALDMAQRMAEQQTET